MSSIVQHQNIEQDTTVTLNKQSYRIGDFCPAADEADIAIKATPLDNNEIGILFITSSRSVVEVIATSLLDRLCVTIQAISDYKHAQMPVSQFIYSESILPLQSASMSNGVNGHSTVDCTDKITPVDPSLLSVIYDSWREVLGSLDLSLDLESDFFAVGGDQVSITLLAAFWQRQDYQITVEDLWDHSSFVEC
ncbi:hypothetical protein PENANT_c001G06724 [Penicillium antarcticum]|uniref:Carrier domain-containing protein n=1 Tax=Penicillium antarcticum TaxID=416450 RepID=A0A1V6QMS4_9EURO|nr:hypothetical protein PENANT_c001G06724 [Penicillium antarcticum]